MKERRRRTCGACGKPLGSTVGKCFDCGGPNPSPSREERLYDATEWKIRLGVTVEQIEAAHNTND